MRDGRQEDLWKYASQICYITAVFQSSDPRKIKRKDFNDWEQIQETLKQNEHQSSSDQLSQIANMFRR